MFQLHANAVKVRAKEEKDQFCKRKWLILYLNSSACDTNTRPVQKLCPSVNGTLLLQPSDLGYIAQMEKYAGPPFGRWHPVTEAEICIPEIDTQHLDHMQPGNLKYSNSSPYFKCAEPPEPQSPCLLCWRCLAFSQPFAGRMTTKL